MKRILLYILTNILINGLFAQTKPFSLDGSYYRLENIDSLDNYSLDSLRGELQYYGINHDSVSGLIFPVVIYKTIDNWTEDYQFRFVLVDTFFVDHLETKGKLLKSNNRLYSDLNYYKTDRINFENRIQLDSILRVKIDIKTDTLWINDKLFKKDRTGRIFQRFTGY